MGRLAYILVGAVFIIALGMVGRADFNDELRAAVLYCDNVAAGVWPDYDGTAEHCPETYATAAEHLPDYTPPRF